MSAPLIKLSIEARGVGRYVANVRLWRLDDLAGDFEEYAIRLDDIASLRVQLDNAADELVHRLWQDAVCGDCDRCQNTRMVDQAKPTDRMTNGGYHCPVCQPKLLTATAARRAGHPPAVDR